MAEPPVIEIREPGRPIRRVVLDRAIEVGRDCDGENLQDDGVSRRHLKLVPSPVSLSVVDLGSRNGTQVNGVPLDGRATLETGDVIRLGRTEIVVVARPVVGPQIRPARPTMSVAGQAVLTLPTPPAPPPPDRAPSRAGSLLQGIFFGRTPTSGEPTFRNYKELPTRVPVRVWHLVRTASVLAYVSLCIALFVRPAGGLFVLFKVIIPLLPILFFVAPGLWRNICPLAASNQAPRWFGFTRGLAPPEWLRKRGYIVALVLFFGIASARLALFNANGAATGVLLSLAIVGAFAAGFTFKGKSGWCSSTCPLLPLQRLYGQTPFALVPNSHCSTCVGCTKNCYDFKPQVAWQADVHDPDKSWSGPRKFFAAALPGFVLGFFALVTRTDLPRVHVYELLALYFLASVGSFFALDALLPLSTAMLTAVYGAIAISLFYWYGGVVVAGSIHTITGMSIPWVRWPIFVVVVAFALIWITRTYAVEQRFLAESAGAIGPVAIQIGVRGSKALQEKAAGDGAQVRFLPADEPVAAETGMSLLEIAEKQGQTIEAGCRMGVCGADPVAVVEGASCLSAPEEEELNTLRRLGLAKNTRMACCARIQSGSVTLSLKPDPGAGPGEGERPVDFDRSITSVVVIGNGIAGVTAADFVRRGHPDCEIHVVGRESHVLYNRMGISRLVYGRSAMQGLYLLAEQWYDEHGITAWLNTLATEIDVASRRVTLGTGDSLYFDRLILAMGSSSVLPSIPGMGAEGSFVMRDAGDAMRIRAYTQQHRSRTAVVAGGGLLGLEAAYALYELGLHVSVLERGSRLLSRQIDARCSELVQAHFDELGIDVIYGAETETLLGTERVETVALKDGRTVPCDLFLAAIGIRPNADLAKAAGIDVNRGVLIDDRMQTSVPGIYAAGDVAEHNGMVFGLWPIAAKQAEVAAVNALGGHAGLVAELPATILKGVALELSSVGRFEDEAGDEVVVLEDASLPSYRRFVVSGGRAVGAVVLGHHPDDLAAATAAVKNQVPISEVTLAALRRGEWRILKDANRAAQAAAEAVR